LRIRYYCIDLSEVTPKSVSRPTPLTSKSAMNTINVVERFANGLAGRYTIKRQIGRGAMGTVYLAWDAKHSRMVAVKVLNEDLSAAIGRARFLREINIAASLSHPHILPLHDSDEADGVLYYVMPFVEGESLRDLLAREKQLPLAQATRLAKEVADALAYAHAHGVIHRDIKPGNIMLESGHAVVADFGLASLSGALNPEHLTQTGTSLGTPLYMSPEQALAQRVDERSDIYSLGCVLYEMLAGDPPFNGNTPQSILAKKLFHPVPPLRLVRDSVPTAIDEVVLKALCKNAADRFASAPDFTHALEAAEHAQARGAPEFGIADSDLFDGDLLIEERSARGFSLSRLFGMVAAALLMLTAIGFLTIAVYDVKMQLPVEYTPSRFDFPIIGARAAIPLLIFVAGAMIALLIMKYVVRLVMYGAMKVSSLSESSAVRSRRGVQLANQTWRSANPETVADLYLIGSIVISFLVLYGLRDLITALAGTDTNLLSSACKSLHNSYSITLSILITVLAFSWRRLLRYMRARRAGRMSIARARWGGLILIVILVLIQTAPWRVLFNNDRPRALLNGERAYVLIERGPDLVVYNAERRATTIYRGETPANFERLNTVGYVFEGAGTCR
jgi:hypothetical protein